jgi:hypothetical protein
MQVFNVGLNLAGYERLISVGLAILVLAALMIFGLTGRSGRLSRWSALLAALLRHCDLCHVRRCRTRYHARSRSDFGPCRCVAGYIGGCSPAVTDLSAALYERHP